MHPWNNNAIQNILPLFFRKKLNVPKKNVSKQAYVICVTMYLPMPQLMWKRLWVDWEAMETLKGSGVILVGPHMVHPHVTLHHFTWVVLPPDPHLLSHCPSNNVRWCYFSKLDKVMIQTFLESRTCGESSCTKRKDTFHFVNHLYVSLTTHYMLVSTSSF